MPAQVPGIPAAGVPPHQGMPAAATQFPGMPAAGVPQQGMPAAGAQPPGMPAAGVPPQEMPGAAAPAPPTGIPMMFDPTQFSQNQVPQAPASSGRGPRYGQRRAYPK